MKYKQILITGGAGFVGSNLAIKLKGVYPKVEVVALDNLKRRGSELNLNRLSDSRIKFIHGDIRNKEDFEGLTDIDLIIECSAEPSVLAGINTSPSYLVNTNLLGTLNCLELARANQAAFLFISTSRVYPIELLNNIKTIETKTRYKLLDKQTIPGVSGLGIAEDFPLLGHRSLYGTTKLASELILEEYIQSYGIKGIVDRCGVITGPWQMGKVDQGVFGLWVARHLFGGKLSYIGFGGTGKQVRDFIHIDDLFDLLNIQIQDFNSFSGSTFNVGGGLENSVSLFELTKVCEAVIHKKILIDSIAENRTNDLKLYITNAEKIRKLTGWQPQKKIEETIRDITQWILSHEQILKPILAS